MNQEETNNIFDSLLDTLDLSKKEFIQYGLNLLNVLGLIAIGYLFYWGYTEQIFTSESALHSLLNQLGPLASLGFICIQIIQTVIPIIPGALTIPMGVMIFGMGYGFFLNFTGIMIGSVINFILARKFGQPLVELLINEKQYNKYIGWLEDKNRFTKLFTFAMFFPLAPDDFLCYVAGLSNLSFKKYFLIITLSKPITLFIYSYGMSELFRFIFQFLL